jgi:hypothetical protein
MLEHTFDLADDIHKDEPVLAVGLSWTNRTIGQLRGFGFMGGRILDYSQRKEEGGDWNVPTDVPLQSGDSGGPLVDSEGHLVGINVRGTPPFVHWILPKSTFPMITARPNRKWLSDVIEKDVATRLAASAGKGCPGKRERVKP